MTVSSTACRTVLAGDGANTAWPFAFRVPQAADLVVVFSDANGNDVTLSPGQYDATGFDQDAGGTVTYPRAASGAPPIAPGTTMTLRRNTPATQPTQISNQGALWPAAIEKALDRLTLLVQQFIDTANRALQVAPTDGTPPAPLPPAARRANAVLGFDASGQPYAATLDAGTVAWSSWLATVFAGAATGPAAAQTALGLGAGATIAAAGSYTLPGGLVVKWGTSGVLAAGGSATVSFATAFPNAPFGVLLTPAANATGFADSAAAASFKAHNTGANPAAFFWIALGN